MRRERASTPAAQAWANTHTAEDRCSAQPRSSASPAEVSERRRMTMEASASRTGKGFQIRTRESAVGLARTRTREWAAESGARRIAASPGQAVPTERRSRSRAWAAGPARGMTGAAPASTAAAAPGPAAVRMPASEAQAWAKTHTEPAEAAVRTDSAADSAGAAHTGSAADSAGAAHTGSAAEPAGAAVRTDSAAGSDRAAVRMDSGPAGRTVPIQIRAAGSSDTPLAVDCGQPSGTGFHLRVCSDAEPGPTHVQVHAPVNASAPATTSSYVPLIGIPMR